LARTGDAEGCGRQDTAADQRNGERIRNDVLIVWKLGGFGRSLKHLVTALDELEALGVAFISLRDSIDLSTPQGKLMLAVIGAMAEFERGSVSRRRESVVLYER
jgi:DNA invertase Pin-like site-specific DNA recombinase